MVAFILRRLLVMLPTLLGITVVAFSLIRMIPGDPVLMMLGERGASPEVYQELKQKLGLDRPLLHQYGVFVGGAIKGDLGQSIATRQPVTKEFWDRFPATVELGLTAVFLAILIGLPIGILAAIYRGRFFDYFFMGTALVGYSMPIFWWGLILIMFFSVGLGWTPVNGRIGVFYEIEPITGFLFYDVWFSEEPWPAFIDAVRHMILPATALATIPLAAIARMTRSSMLEVLGEDYMRTARAKGLSRARIILVHGLRNAMVPVVTVIGLMISTILTGAVLTETIFSWPGIGKWIVASVFARDYPVVQGGILLIAVMIVVVNLGVDIVYAIVNPRMRGQK